MKNNLLKQVLRFAVVGGISFVVDFVVTNVIARLIRGINVDSTKAAMIGALVGFIISIIVNYFLSMRFVFVRKDNMNRGKEFTIFVVLSIIGLGLNELIILGCMSLINNVVWVGAFTQWCTDAISLAFVMTFEGVATAGSKIIATAVVMVFNFVTRKMFLEKKDDGEEENELSDTNVSEATDTKEQPVKESE